VQPHGLDQEADVRLRMREPQRLSLRAEPLGEAREVDHQRRVGEAQTREIDDDVAGGVEGSGERTPAAAARRSVLVSLDPKDRELCVEADDAGELTTYPQVRTPLVVRIFLHSLPMIAEDDVYEALSNVIDPELGLDFVELGLIYGLEIDESTVNVTFTLTTPACPIGPQVTEQIQEFVGELPGVETVNASMVFTPPWSPDKMSEDAKFALGY
jgi:metal-sulfur cluster biosynthetic enzyme